MDYTDAGARRRALPEPPFSIDLLAALHAGALEEDVADHVRRLSAGDERAQQILAGLDATTADLDALGDQDESMPNDVEARLRATIDDLASDAD